MKTRLVANLGGSRVLLESSGQGEAAREKAGLAQRLVIMSICPLFQERFPQ